MCNTVLSSKYSVRGTLGSFLLLSSNTGVFLAFLVGAFFHFTFVPFLGLTLSVSFLTALFFIHESPQYLLQTNQLDKAEKSSVFYHGGVAVSTDDKLEKQIDAKVLPESPKKEKITIDDFRK